MSRTPTGQIIERRTARGVAYDLRITVGGDRRQWNVGHSANGWTRARMEDERANVLADVRRGIWPPPTSAPREPVAAVPLFHEFASIWFAARKASGLKPRSLEYLEWALSEHLLPHFEELSIDAFTIERVDKYTTAKATEGRLSNRSVNKTLDVLSSVLETAVEYEHLRTNPARGRRRRLPVSKQTRSYLDSAEQIAALLDAATTLDEAARLRRGQRRALLATLAFAGLRIGEALDLRWVDVNLADGRLKVRDAKTAAGVRAVTILPALRDELVAYKARAADTAATTRVFGTTTGGRQSETNVRRRILAPAVAIADEAFARAGVEPMPTGLTPHSLRRTYASVLAALGEPMPSVIRQLGHTDPALTLRIYSHDMARTEEDRQRLRDLVDGGYRATYRATETPADVVSVVDA